MLLMKKTLCLAIMAVSSFVSRGQPQLPRKTEVASCDNYINNRYPLVLDYYRTIFSWSFALEMKAACRKSPICQSTDFRKLDFHFNASLAAINSAKKAACVRESGYNLFHILEKVFHTQCLICLNDLFACLGSAQTRKLLTNFSKNSFYLL